MLDYFPDKPKGMHQWTCLRLRDRARAASIPLLAGMSGSAYGKIAERRDHMSDKIVLILSEAS